MSNTIELLEGIGRDAALRHAAPEVLEKALQGMHASEALRMAAANGDKAPLIQEFGANVNLAVQVEQSAARRWLRSSREDGGPSRNDDDEDDEKTASLCFRPRVFGCTMKCLAAYCPMFLAFLLATMFPVVASSKAAPVGGQQLACRASRSRPSRSGQPTRSDSPALLERLHQQESLLTPAQRWHLRYLDTSQLTFRGEYAKAEPILRDIIDHASDPNIVARATASRCRTSTWDIIMKRRTGWPTSSCRSCRKSPIR